MEEHTEDSISPVKIFYCYAPEDRQFHDELSKHLTPLKLLGRIIEWHDREIQAGTEWEREINVHLNRADIIILLLSADFLSSEYCWGVMRRALERPGSRGWVGEERWTRQEIGTVTIVPIVARPIDWPIIPFNKIGMVHSLGKPITLWSDRDSAFRNMAVIIRRIVEAILLDRMEKKYPFMGRPDDGFKTILEVLSMNEMEVYKKYRRWSQSTPEPKFESPPPVMLGPPKFEPPPPVTPEPKSARHWVILSAIFARLPFKRKTDK